MDSDLTQDATQIQGSLDATAFDIEEKEEKVSWGKAVCVDPVNDSQYPDVHFYDDLITFGRASSNTVHVNNPAVSGVHCTIKREPDYVVLTDKSTNGTYVSYSKQKMIHLRKTEGNQIRIITSGDTICLLRTKSLTIKYEITIYKHAHKRAHQNSEMRVTEKFETLRKLGSGTFATVKEVVERSTRETYAMKVIDIKKFHESNGSLRKNALDTEVEVMAKLNHPNIVKYHWHHKTDRNLFVVLELVKGGDLFDALVAYGKGFSEDVSRSVFIQLVRAVQYLHENGVVHRDIKPENILLTTSTPSTSMEVKLADFGLSRAVTTSNKANTICGTWQYLAPEVYEEKEEGYGKEVDAWSCGVVLYILLSGCQPFGNGDNNHNPALVEQITKARFSFPSAQWGSISAGAKDMIKKLLIVDPAKRWTLPQVMEHKWFKEGLQAQAITMDTSLSLPDQHPAFSPPRHGEVPSPSSSSRNNKTTAMSEAEVANHVAKKAKFSEAHDEARADFAAFLRHNGDSPGNGNSHIVAPPAFPSSTTTSTTKTDNTRKRKR